jgi:uncharacterized protein (TIGR02145 family)
MKKSTIFIFFILVVLEIQAQNYFISFAGSGDTTVVSTIQISNLTSGDSITINSGDILHLVPATGIGGALTENKALQIYPVPVTNEAVLTFFAPENNNTRISISDLLGRTVCNYTTVLQSGQHRFRISGIGMGIYFVEVSVNNNNYSAKLISMDKGLNEPKIEYLSSSDHASGLTLKSITTTIDMPFTNGDLLIYKGNAGHYTLLIPDSPSGSKTVTFNFAGCTDADGNDYPTLQLGSQIWMASNLNVGNMVVDTTSQASNGIIEKYCYENNPSDCNIYGGLYQWGEMMQYDTMPGSQGICPNGWHIPDNNDWNLLMNFLGGDSIAGGKMKEQGTAHWASPNTDATNESGFTALPGGYRYYSGTLFLTDYAIFWSSSQSSLTDAWFRQLYFNYRNVYKHTVTKTNGFSIRCIKD